jgi:hypothetical protein
MSTSRCDVPVLALSFGASPRIPFYRMGNSGYLSAVLFFVCLEIVEKKCRFLGNLRRNYDLMVRFS